MQPPAGKSLRDILADGGLCAAAISELAAMRRFEEAELLAQEAATLHPDHVLVAVERAGIAHRRRDYAEAHRRWRGVLSQFPGQWVGVVGAWRSFRDAGPDPLYRAAAWSGANGEPLTKISTDAYDQFCWAAGWTAGAMRRAFGPPRADAAPAAETLERHDVGVLPYFFFQGHWPADDQGRACRAAMGAALSVPDAGQTQFLGIDGLSGLALRIFLNTLIKGMPRARYLELGVGAGSVMAAALHGNDVHAVGVDDFSENPDARGLLQDNLAGIDRGQCSFVLIERSFAGIALDDHGPFDVLFYDGPVAATAVVQAISAALPAMRETAIYILDDWNFPDVRNGYLYLLEQGFAEEIASIDVRTTLDNTHPAFYGPASGWHNGCRIALLKRRDAPRMATILPPIALAETGVRILSAETATPFAGRGSVRVGEQFPNADFFARSTTTAALNRYVFTDAVCSFATTLVYVQGRAVRELAYLVSEQELHGPPPAPSETAFQEFPQTVVQPLSRAWANYYHWLAQCLPAIVVGVTAARDTVLALPSLTPHQEESLHLLGLQDYPRFPIHPRRAYGFRSLEVSDFALGNAAFRISTTVRDVFHALKAQVPNERVAGPKLYVTRRYAGHRHVHNDAALTELLAQRGFEIVDPGQFSIAQQINLFRNARAIVAPHGAALTNIGFCEPGAQVYELMPVAYANACFNRIAQAMDLDWAADVFPCDDFGEPFVRSFTADLRLVSARLDMFGL